MLNSYFILNRLTVELNQLLSGYFLVSAFTQDKDKIILHFKNEAGDSNALEFNTTPNFPYLVVRSNFSRARKNTIDFFEDYLPSKIVNIEIAKFERVLKFSFLDFSIYLILRGGLSNVYLVESSLVYSFKNNKSEEQSALVEEIINLSYSDNYRFVETDKESFSSFEEIKEVIPPFLKSFYPHLTKESSIISSADLNSFLLKIYLDTLVVYTDSNGKLKLQPQILKPHDAEGLFSGLKTSEALSFFLANYYKTNTLLSKKKRIEKLLFRELEFYSDKLNHLMNRIEMGDNSEELMNIGNLLLINLHQIRTGEEKAVVPNLFGNSEDLEIKLDSKLSPRENADKYFKKARHSKLSYEGAIDNYELTEKRYNKLLNLKTVFLEIKTVKELDTFIEQNNLKLVNNNDKNSENSSKFKHFIILDKYHLFVGKDSRNNDELTVGFAKQNDYWFHAKGVSGSHAIIRVDNTKEGVPKPVLQKAASVAAYYSKAKNASLVPVSYTFKKYVVKRKGMEPGKVGLLKEDVLMVKPEIPKDVIPFDTNEFDLD